MLARSLLLAALVLAASASPALADKGGRHRGDWTQGFDQRGGRNDDGDRNNDGQRQRSVRSVREVADQVCQLSRGGELLSARLEDGSRPVYVLRCRMPNGEVRDFRVDAAR